MTILPPIPGVRLLGGGVAFPSDVDPRASDLTNDDVHATVVGLAPLGRDPEFPERVWGVRRRQWCRGRDGTLQVETTDLAVLAGRRALQDAGLASVDLLLVATSTPDRITATSAARVAEQLDLTCGAFDIHGAGAGGVLALMTAAQFLAGGLRSVLVVAADAGSPLVAADDLTGRLLFADGSGAVVLGRSASAPGVLGGVLATRQARGQAFTVPGALPPSEGGSYVFRHADAQYKTHLDAAWTDLLTRFRESLSAPVDLFLPYPVTLAQIRAAAVALDVPLQRTWHTLGEHGCIGCAGPVVSLVERRARFGLSGTVALAAVAGGLTGAALSLDFAGGAP